MKFKTPTLTDKLEEKNLEIQRLTLENEELKKKIEELEENLRFQKFKFDEQAKEVKKERGRNKSIQDSAKWQNIVIEQLKVWLFCYFRNVFSSWRRNCKLDLQSLKRSALNCM